MQTKGAAVADVGIVVVAAVAAYINMIFAPFHFIPCAFIITYTLLNALFLYIYITLSCIFTSFSIRVYVCVCGVYHIVIICPRDKYREIE
jgi:hypothetical protein